MATSVSVLLGPARSGKTTRLVSLYRRVLEGREFGRGLWLAPTHRAADEVRARLVTGGDGRCGSGGAIRGCLKPNVCTFAHFAETVVQRSPLPVQQIDAAGKRQIIGRLIDEQKAAGKLVHFAAIASKPGLVDLVAGLFADLKRQEIWPDEFSAVCARPGRSAKDRELAELYDAYQQLLNEHQLYDAEGRFWSARERLQQGEIAPYDAVTTVVVDGFTDFTRTQHEILGILAGRAKEMMITLPWDEAGGERSELFQKCRSTHAELERRHPGLRREFVLEECVRDFDLAPLIDSKGGQAPRRNAVSSFVVAPEGDSPIFARRTAQKLGQSPKRLGASPLEHIERNLFKDPRRIEPAAAAPGVEIIAAGGQLGELESVAREIKQLLVEGDGGTPVRPADIVVVFRSTADIAPLVDEVFSEFGIPASIEARLPVSRAPIYAALRSLLQLAADDWTFRGLLCLLGHNYVQPSWNEWQPANRSSAERMIHRLQIPRGREALLGAVERSARVELSEDSPAARLRHRETALAARGILARLSDALEVLPREVTAGEWQTALVKLAGELGLLRAMEDDCSAALAKFDRVAWRQLLDGLDASQRLETQLDGRPAQFSLHELIARLDEIAGATDLPPPNDDVGRVRVISAASVRTLDVPFLFVAGLSEKAFPAPFGEHHLYSVAECRAMNEAGLRFVGRQEWASQEMLLFYEVVTRATRRLTLSYPALDEKAQPLSPSPYLLELERLFAGGAIARHEEPSLSPVMRDKAPACVRDLRVTGVARAIEGDGKLAAGLLSPGGASDLVKESAANLFAALRMTGQRAKREAFGPFEGVFWSEAAQRRLAERFGDEHCWGTSRLEGYAYCPFKFFAQHVLALEEPEDLALEIDHLRRGRRLHELMAEVHRQLNAAAGPCSPVQQDEESFKRLVGETLARVIESSATDGPLAAALDEFDSRMIAAWLDQYLEQHRKYDGGFAECDRPLLPKHFEVSFGPVAAQSDGDTDPLSTESVYELRCGDVVVRLSGRIDRLDVGLVGGQVVFNVLDYKIGAAKQYQLKDIESGAILQLPLYAMAVEDLLLAGEKAVPWAGGYWHVKDGGYREKHSLKFHEQRGGKLRPTAAWEQLKEELIDRVARIVTAVRSGQFPMHCDDEHCTGRCEYKTVCRVGTVRALEKTWLLPVLSVRDK